MNLTALDWAIVAALFPTLAGLALFSRHYSRSVADFLAGNRCAGRYLLTLSEGIAGLGLVGVIANFEKFYHNGFAASWWGSLLGPISLVLALAGWVNYRYRETRALTMAQFFEMRYSRRFRVFAGIVAWVSGVLNFGIFPGIVARFIVYFCGLPPVLSLGGHAFPTIAPVMAFMLGTTLLLTLSGGMVTVMVTDFFQAQFINITFLVIAAALLSRFTWGDITSALTAVPRGKSLINPFDQSGLADFDVWFFAIFAFKLFYNRLGWQGTQGFNCAAKSPHEARMAGVLAEWRGGVSYLMFTLMPICAYTLLHHAKFAAQAQTVHATLATIADPQIRGQMTVPVALVRMLPPGLAGLLCAAMIAGTIGNDTTYLHAWGSIFIQDVIMPFRRQPFGAQAHIRLLRWSIGGVAAFAFVYSLLFPMRDYIIMYQLVTGAIYLGGSGAVIIGGLYWSKGTNAAAWAALITGSVLAVLGTVLRGWWPAVPFLARLAPEFPLNGAWMALVASLLAIVVYVTVSLATCRVPCDMDRLLHRGRFDADGEHRPAARPHPLRWLGITDEFTRGDRCIYFLKIGWSGFWFACFAAGTVWSLVHGISDAGWARWWLFQVSLTLAVGAATVVWFLWGGIRDLRDLLAVLADARRDQADDGRVLPADQARSVPL